MNIEAGSFGRDFRDLQEIAGQFRDHQVRSLSEFGDHGREKGPLALDGPFLREKEEARKERLSTWFRNAPRRNRISAFHEFVFRNQTNGTEIEQRLAASRNPTGPNVSRSFSVLHFIRFCVTGAMHGGLQSIMIGIHEILRM